MAVLVTAIHDLKKDVDARHKAGHDKRKSQIKKAAAMAAFFFCVCENGQLFDCPLVCARSLPMRLKRAFCSLLNEA